MYFYYIYTTIFHYVQKADIKKTTNERGREREEM